MEVPEGEEDKTPEEGAGGSEREVRGEGIHLEEERPRGLQLELPATMTPTLAEETGSCSALTEDDGGVRRRNKRRKGKKAPH